MQIETRETVTQARRLSSLFDPNTRLPTAFWLIRHAEDARSARLARFAEVLAAGVRAEVVRLEGPVRK